MEEGRGRLMSYVEGIGWWGLLKIDVDCLKAGLTGSRWPLHVGLGVDVGDSTAHWTTAA